MPARRNGRANHDGADTMPGCWLQSVPTGRRAARGMERSGMSTGFCDPERGVGRADRQGDVALGRASSLDPAPPLSSGSGRLDRPAHGSTRPARRKVGLHPPRSTHSATPPASTRVPWAGRSSRPEPELGWVFQRLAGCLLSKPNTSSPHRSPRRRPGSRLRRRSMLAALVHHLTTFLIRRLDRRTQGGLPAPFLRDALDRPVKPSDEGWRM